ncbi:MAG TPA: TolC family protein [Pseudobdellovibrionaceae bacterium]|jgi:outer membrane protein TolC
MRSHQRAIWLVGILTLTSQSFAQNNFEEVIAGAVKKVEEVQSKESELRSAELSRTQSQMRFLPDLNLSSTYTEEGPAWDQRNALRNYGLRSNLNLFRFGGDYFYYKSTDLTMESLRWDLKNTKLTLEATISGKALDYIANHLETEIRKKITEAQQNFFNIAEKRYAKGILSKQELDQITIDFKNAQAHLTDAQLTEFQAKEALKIYLGEGDIQATWPWLDSLKKMPRKKVAFNVQSHPEWQLLQNKVQAFEYAQKNKFSEMLPSLDLSLSYTKENSAYNNDPNASPWVTQWVSGITLTIPLFSRLENYTLYRQAIESKFRTDLELQRSSRELDAQWKVSENDFHTQLASVLVREQTLKISNNLYQDNLRRFQAGRSTANDLLNDQERLYQSELLAIQGWKAVHLSYIKLCHAMGQLVTECGLKH